MKVEPLTAEHCRNLRVQPLQVPYADILREEAFVNAVVAGGQAYAVCNDERVLAVGGVVDQGGGRATCWSFVGAELGTSMTGCVRAAKKVIGELEYRRVEAMTHSDFPPAHRLMKLLGFQMEASLRAWFPDRSPGWLWSRIQ